jgi:RNA methyltransferase, TrmH family
LNVAVDSRITSRQHPVVQRFRRLIAKRREGDGILLDGAHLVAEALDAGVPVEVVLTDGRAPDLSHRARAAGAAVYAGSAAVLEAASPVRTPTGTVAIASWQPAALSDLFTRTPALVLGLSGVQDPGNAGSVVRSADALGGTGVAMLDGGADPAGWRALRGAMGSTFHLPVARGTTNDLVQAARQAGVRLAATVAAGGERLESVDLRSPIVVLLGNEGAGLAADVVEHADLALTVPMRPGVDSLNVAVTAAVILYEARRQRAGATS